MSQFDQNVPPPDTTNTPGRKNSSIIYLVIIAALVAGCIYLFVSRNHVAADKDMALKQDQQRYDSLKTDRASLQADFDAASSKIDQLTTANSKMDSALQNNKAQMAGMQAKIRGILGKSNATAAELKSAREMISSLQDKTRQYEERIAELEKENTNLSNKNDVLTKEVDSTVTQNIALKRAGSILHASNIRMEPIHKRHNGKEKETTKARRVDLLRITFDIDENRIAESGTKQLYVRILTPDNTVINNPALGSGALTASNGQQVSYTMMKEVALEKGQPLKNIDIDWNQGGEYAKGAYKIEIYSEGYLVGSGSVTLK